MSCRQKEREISSACVENEGEVKLAYKSKSCLQAIFTT